jgi:hypothetical protein
MRVKYYNNTSYISSAVPNSFAVYAQGSCGGAPVSTATIDLRNNIFDGSVISVNGMTSASENYNDIGGAQKNAGFSVDGSAVGSQGKINVNPMYVGASAANFHLQSGSPCINAGESGLTASNDMGAY